jgi:site-specific recombinase XerD
MNNKYPQITFVFDRRRIASSTIKSSVDMRICYNYKQRFIATGIKLYVNQWKNGKIVNCPDIMQISQTLDKMLTDVRQIILEMEQKGSIDIFAIPDKFKERNTPKINFIDFCNQRATIRKYGKKSDSQERYNRFIRLFTAWGGIREFEDINDKSIVNYDKYLDSTGMKPYSKWNNYHRFLNSFILDAIDAGYIKRNPYKWINIDKQKRSHGIERCLTPEEFHRLKTSKMPTESIERVRDIFVFQTYTCLSYSDLKEFDPMMIQEIKGMNVYVGNRKKTNMTFTIPLLSPALDILHKYNGKLPIISNVKYNEYLKVVAQSSGIDKPLSTHWARHTGATLLLNEGVPMQIVSKICGHSSTRITEQVYAKLLDETVVDAIQDLDI